ncbi:phage tail-collar fiber domain-containing protein [Candidatus Vondammii sp. HM_W22]|uniref:phage tail-collar fiber domain-containing protein n=1 Tax=Candidatus Vondammii sp. HM_W22 TaxID=2687299 RepID=UPI001F14809F|nr:phage tail protein [Candidatus Vondammii sp. HM_W22]
MSNYYTLLTAIGQAQLTNAQALGQSLTLAELAIGDGNGAYVVPTEQQTKLVKEVWRNAINQIYIDNDNANWLVIETVVPETVGGWTAREVGVFDSEGNLIAVGAYPETYKSRLAEGSGRDLYIRMILQISNAARVELKIDPAVVVATRHYVDDELDNHQTANIAHSWKQISNKPATFPPSSHSNSWDQTTGKPATFPPGSHSHSWNQTTGKPSTFPPSSHDHSWGQITGKPSTFPPAAHSHEPAGGRLIADVRGNGATTDRNTALTWALAAVSGAIMQIGLRLEMIWSEQYSYSHGNGTVYTTRAKRTWWKYDGRSFVMQSEGAA